MIISFICIDNEPPVIECPDAIVQPVDTNMMTTSVALKVNSTDNVNLDYTMCTMHNATGTVLDMTLQMFVYGSHSVFCQAVDTSGLSSTCTFPVNITGECERTSLSYYAIRCQRGAVVF